MSTWNGQGGSNADKVFCTACILLWQPNVKAWCLCLPPASRHQSRGMPVCIAAVSVALGGNSMSARRTQSLSMKHAQRFQRISKKHLREVLIKSTFAEPVAQKPLIFSGSADPKWIKLALPQLYMPSNPAFEPTRCSASALDHTRTE